ncbi:cysteine proteinase [Thozetella sp. PMI_491]|nr:cysteine proteinase [Thozetella sp. PMI_491]
MSDKRDFRTTIDAATGTIDPFALAEALIGRKIDRHSMAASSTISDMQADYDDLVDVKHDPVLLGMSMQPDKQPKNVHVGCINPFALVEALLGKRIDRCSMSAAKLISDVLQTDYDELFDMRHNSVLYAGLKFNKQGRHAEELSDKDMKILNERDLETPDLSQIDRMGDLEKVGLKDVLKAQVKMARMENGKLHVVLHTPDMGKVISNQQVTMSMNELALPFRKRDGKWTPPNSSWEDLQERFVQSIAMRMREMERSQMGDVFRIGDGRYPGFDMRQTCPVNRFDDPVQGATGNSWLIAALFSVAWASPTVINRYIRATDQSARDPNQKKEQFSVKFHDKGGKNNAPTATVEVNYEVPVNNSDQELIYCRASDGSNIWPSLYEKAFVKWVADSSSDRPDMTQIYNGDPIKAMAQINGRDPQYYFTDRHSASELVGLVRSCSVNFKTINAMCAYTHASGSIYRGANLVANHAYSVLGWSGRNTNQYIILRNPWGVTEPVGLTSYPGLIDRVEAEFWRPATLLDRGGVIALEATAFKEYFACIGMTK